MDGLLRGYRGGKALFDLCSFLLPPMQSFTMARKDPSSPTAARPAFQRFLMVLALIALAVFLLRILGVPIVWRTEKTEILDNRR